MDFEALGRQHTNYYQAPIEEYVAVGMARGA
jgi:hypothetical protein